MQTFETLVKAHNPNASVREITKRAGIPQNRLAYWLKPGSHVERMPTPETITILADAIGASPREVFLAFAADLGYPI